MYFPSRRVTIVHGQTLRWTMQGVPGQNAGLEFQLQFSFVTLQNGQKGFVIVLNGSEIPDQIDLGPQREFEVANYKGQVLYLEGCEMNITFENNTYTILKLNKVDENGGDMYFHSYPPKDLPEGSTGDIVFHGGMVYELATGA